MVERVTPGSRFLDSSDDDDDDDGGLAPPRRGIGRQFGDATESLPASSPAVHKRTPFSQLFSRTTKEGRKGSDVNAIEAPPGSASGEGEGDEDGGPRRSSSGSIVSKRTGKEKRFQGLRKLFRIKE